MKNQVGFLAIGQCGANITTLMEEKGYKCMYINTSQEDLSTLKNANYIYHIPNSEGSHKNRSVAKKLIAANVEEIINEITKTLSAKYIFVSFSLGGGTGSGISPYLCQSLIARGKIVMPIVVLPSEKESLRALNNACQCVSELDMIENLGSVFFLDNNKHDNKLQINKQFTETLDAFLTTENSSVLGNIDKAEIKTLLQSSGSSILIKLSKEKSTNTDLINKLYDNIYAPIEKDKIVTYIGISKAKECITLDKLVNEIGMPLDDFQGYGSNYTVCMISGLTYPISRLNQIKAIVESDSKKISDNIKDRQILSIEPDNSIDDLLKLTKPKKPDSSKLDTRNFLLNLLTD